MGRFGSYGSINDWILEFNHRLAKGSFPPFFPSLSLPSLLKSRGKKADKRMEMGEIVVDTMEVFQVGQFNGWHQSTGEHGQMYGE